MNASQSGIFKIICIICYFDFWNMTILHCVPEKNVYLFIVLNNSVND